MRLTSFKEILPKAASPLKKYSDLSPTYPTQTLPNAHLPRSVCLLAWMRITREARPFIRQRLPHEVLPGQTTLPCLVTVYRIVAWKIIPPRAQTLQPFCPAL